MSQVSIQNFAKQIDTSIEKLLSQLADAGIAGKGKHDELNDAEKNKLLQFLRGDSTRGEISRPQITLKRKTTSEIKQTSRTGAARTVSVEVKKRRIVVKHPAAEPQTVELAAEQPAKPQHAQAMRDAPSEKQAQEPAPTARKHQQPAAKPVADEPQKPPQLAAQEARAAPPALKQPPPQLPAEQSEVAPKTAAKTPLPTAVARAPKPKSAAPPAPKDTPRKKANKNRKGKARDGSSKRAELHVADGRVRKTRRKPLRKPSKISSSISSAHAFAKPTAPVVHEIHIADTISVSELAQALSIKAGELIKTMMAMGSMVTSNQMLDQDTAILVVEELGHVAKAVTDEDPELLLLASDGEQKNLQSRPPVVTVMGHVDHGKTSLLDFIRNSKVATGEAGGITQHIGAYKVELEAGEICFLDTPGHEAFSAMRVRGAQATDLVILVVAADDGVKPQTIEAIRHARAAGAPIIVAINKIDREQADVDKVKQELSNHEVVSEKWGGDVLMNEISALSGEGVDHLLESVLLQAEVLDLKARHSGAASGLVIEARLDKGRGPAATVLVQQGMLRKGDIVLAGRESGRVRLLMDDQGKTLNQAGPSTPVEIYGLAGVPVAGDDLLVVSDERKAREVADLRQNRHKERKLAKQQKHQMENVLNRMNEGETKAINLLIKGDVQGSVEALSESMEKMSGDEVRVKVVHGMVGGINESDVNLAVAAGALIIAFNVRADATARKLIERGDVAVHYYNVIYEAVDLVKALMSGMLAPITSEQQVGLVEVREVFKAPKIGAIAGSYVTEGAVKRNLPVRVLRDNIVIFEGALDSLRRFKDDVNEVKSGFECGIGIKNYNDIKVGDQIEVFEIVETAQQL